MKNASSRIQEHHSLLIRSFSSKIPKHVFHHLSLEGCEVNLENAANSPSDVPDGSDPLLLPTVQHPLSVLVQVSGSQECRLFSIIEQCVSDLTRAVFVPKNKFKACGGMRFYGGLSLSTGVII
ncbi:hypothetical protein TNCV_911261 [Trichonephila clavipes]|nr:hypothetical protein TNCV_911261 [Trichonephila clavipes]